MTDTEIELLNFGNRIKELREQKNMTLLKLAERAGLSIYELTEIEAGKIDVFFTTMDDISQGLDISLKEFFEYHA
jgi:transcriptional regulator with XRE-family HTH domain